MGFRRILRKCGDAQDVQISFKMYKSRLYIEMGSGVRFPVQIKKKRGKYGLFPEI